MQSMQALQESVLAVVCISQLAWQDGHTEVTRHTSGIANSSRSSRVVEGTMSSSIATCMIRCEEGTRISNISNDNSIPERQQHTEQHEQQEQHEEEQQLLNIQWPFWIKQRFVSEFNVATNRW